MRIKYLLLSVAMLSLFVACDTEQEQELVQPNAEATPVVHQIPHDSPLAQFLAQHKGVIFADALEDRRQYTLQELLSWTPDPQEDDLVPQPKIPEPVREIYVARGRNQQTTHLVGACGKSSCRTAIPAFEQRMMQEAARQCRVLYGSIECCQNGSSVVYYFVALPGIYCPPENEFVRTSKLEDEAYLR